MEFSLEEIYRCIQRNSLEPLPSELLKHAEQLYVHSQELKSQYVHWKRWYERHRKRDEILGGAKSSSILNLSWVRYQDAKEAWRNVRSFSRWYERYGLHAETVKDFFNNTQERDPIVFDVRPLW